jgi:tetratricopeptide (TPR) repeat protein
MDVATAVGLTPLVGRDSEIALLLERWARVQEGRGQVVLLSGEAGIGKSRLLQALQGHIAQKSHTRLECRSSPYYQNSALYPLVDLLQRLLQGPPDEVSSGALERLEELLAPCDLATAEVVPLFTTLLALPLPADRYPPLGLSAEQHRHKTLEALLAFVLAQTAHQPVVFLLEDLHWTDPSTLEWLTLLIEQSPTASILTLLTCRPEFQPPWGGKSHLTPLTLQRLTRVQIEAMVARVTGGKTLPGDVLQHLIEKSDGVPLYVEEMTKAILESGVLKTSNGHYTLSAPLTALAIPSTLQDSLMARLDRLGDAKGIAQLGATLGRQFAYAVLQAVAQADEAAVQQALRRLVEAELVYQRGVLPEATYTFKHALIQDIAYQSLLKSVRQQHHQRIVQVLEAHFPEIVNSQPALLAHHAWHGEVWYKALRYFRQAGADAVQQSAYQEAVVCFEQALDALQHLPEGRDTRELAIDLRLNLRSAIMPLWQYDRLLTTLREADALAEALGDPHRLARVAAYLTHALFLTGESKQAFIAGQRAVSLSAPLKDGSFQREARFRMAQVSFILGQYGLAIEGFRQNVDALVHERRQETSGGAREAVLYLRWLAQPLAEIGRFPESMARGEEAVRIAEEIVHPFSLSNAYVGAGYLSLRKGDVSRAVAFYTRGMDLCRRWHILQMLHGHALGLCVALGMSGQVTEALALLEQVVLQPPSPGLGVSGMPESPTLGEIYLRVGRLEEAFYYTEQALVSARAQHERGREAWLLRFLGEIVTRRDPLALDHAASYYQQALAIATELGMRPLQAHCHHGLGTLYRQMNREEQARAALSTAIDLYREMDMVFWLPTVEAALAVSSL